MIKKEDVEYILSKAYVPEHIVSLIKLISSGEPYLMDDHLFLVKDRLLMFIGYPLQKKFDQKECADLIVKTANKFNTDHIRLIAPFIPETLIKECEVLERDAYYRLDINGIQIENDLERVCRKASEKVSVYRGKRISNQHRKLISEFMERAEPGSRVRDLYMSMDKYIPSSETAYTLDARDRDDKLTAFYVVDEAADRFHTYLIGCHSRDNYVPHASDLLLREMIRIAQNEGKDFIHLGLGVNEGIRRFKEKWSGYPFLDYEYCEMCVDDKVKGGIMDYLGSKL